MPYYLGKNTPVKKTNFLTVADKVLHDRALSPAFPKFLLPAFIPLLAIPSFLLLRHTKLNTTAELLQSLVLITQIILLPALCMLGSSWDHVAYQFAYINSLEKQSLPNIFLLKEPPPTPYQLPNHTPSLPLPYFTSFTVWLVLFHSNLELTFVSPLE